MGKIIIMGCLREAGPKKMENTSDSVMMGGENYIDTTFSRFILEVYIMEEFSPE